ncbi:MAG: hypothetical protein CVT81_11895 [Alphaproteobacteria bacterium HGW-Alphaproteobacteria-3]|nr:MAG: hypothetical protein CVT81_11895 [Alphaproteobacteria bacterium HGW-Alphaproteobacteria-3]
MIPGPGNRQPDSSGPEEAHRNYPYLDGFRTSAYVPRMDRDAHIDFGRKLGLELALRGALLCA